MSRAPPAFHNRRRTSHRQFSADRNVYSAHTIKCNAFQGSVTMSDQSEDMGPGMLTDTQRDYLRGDLDVKSGSQRERTIRSRIRKRVTNSISDLLLLDRNIEERDLSQISKDFDPNHIQTGKLVGFFLRCFHYITPYLNQSSDKNDFENTSMGGLDSKGRYAETDQEQSDELVSLFEMSISKSLSEVYRNAGYDAAEISVDIDIIIGQKLDSLAEQDPQSWSVGQLFKLHHSNKIENEVFYSEVERRDLFGENIEPYDDSRWDTDN